MAEAPILNWVRLVDFKSHKDSTITFGPFSILQGTNSSGKTSIIKAIRTILFNENFPAKWIRRGRKKAMIGIGLTNGTVLWRIRTPSTQQWKIIPNKGKKIVVTGKKDVTELIASHTGIQPVVLDDPKNPENLNIVRSRAGLFILGGRSDTVLRKISGIIGDSALEETKRELVNSLRRLDSDIDSDTSIIRVARERRDALSIAYDVANTKTKLCVARGNELTESIRTVEEGNRVLQEFRNSKLKFELADATMLSIQDVSKRQLLPRFDKLLEFDQARAALSDFVVLEDIDLPRITELMKGIDSRLEISKRQTLKMTDLFSALSVIDDTKQEISWLDEQIEEFVKELESLEAEQKEKRGKLKICPVCKQAIPELLSA